jgi:prepilin-type processing-associated H-X9-DG protein
MRTKPIHNARAFTLIELIMVIMILVVVIFMLFPGKVSHSRSQASRITCINNLKEIGLAYRLWHEDDDHEPASQSVSRGGWAEFLTNADQGFLCWTNYVIMARELGENPRVLVCPADERKPANTLTNFGNSNLSYFVGVSAGETYPQSLLGGDRNLGAGTKPDREYGFSPESGRGNDVAIQTNSQSGPVCWSLKMHSLGNSGGAGNILFGDGSVQQVTTLSFRTTWQPVAGLTTNWPAGHVPSSPSFRVLFP